MSKKYEYAAPPLGITAAYENAVTKLAQQKDAIDKLDTKAAALIGLLGVVIGGYIVGARTNPERWIGGTGLALAITCLIYGYSIRAYADAPEPRRFADYAGYTKEQMQELFLDAVLNAIDWNARRVKWKGRALNAALVLLALFAVVILVVIAMKFDPRV